MATATESTDNSMDRTTAPWGRVLTIGEGRPGPEGATAGPSSTRPRLVSSPMRSAMVERLSPVVAVSSERETGPWRWRLSTTAARL